jgi:hypothetical protein
MGFIEHDRSDNQRRGACEGCNSGSIDDYLCGPGEHLRVYRSERHGSDTGFDQRDAGELFGRSREHGSVHGNGNVQ